MSWLPKREKLDPKQQASAIDFAVAQDVNFYVSGEAGTGKSVVLAHIAAKFKRDNPEAKVAALTYTNAFAACLGEGLKGCGVEVQTILRFRTREKYDLIVVDVAMTRSRKNLMMSYSGAAGDQTERARTYSGVDFFSGIQDDYEQGVLL